MLEHKRVPHWRERAAREQTYTAAVTPGESSRRPRSGRALLLLRSGGRQVKTIPDPTDGRKTLAEVTKAVKL